MQAATVEILNRKGQFPMEQAVVIAEAIDMSLQGAQLVTVPILDARFAAQDAGIDARFVALEAKFDARFAVFEARFEALEARFAALEARLERKFDRLRLQLVMIVLANAAFGPLGAAALEAIRRAF